MHITSRKVLASAAAAAVALTGCSSSKTTTASTVAAATTAAATTVAPAGSTAAATTAAPAAATTAKAPAAATGEKVTIKYQLWDDAQLPFYQECATAFTKANPNITVEVKQLGWGDYWDGLAAGFATGNVPDVFTDHLAKYPDWIKSGVIIPIDDFVAKDGWDLKQYQTGLADLWVSPEGKRYGLPKDWDTIALVTDANKLDKAGVKADEFNTADWNAKDGGSFEKIIAKLSVDKNGKNGADPAFDKTKVAQYGFGMDAADAYGQTGWSSFAASNGFTYLDKNPWGTKYNYDNPGFVDTIGYFRALIAKGFMAPVDEWAATGGDTMFSTGKVAVRPIGDWTINQWLKDKTQKALFVKTPKGPKGYASMFNGLADAITKSSKHPAESWAWMKFMGSKDCQNIVGKGGVIFPAIPESTKLSIDAHTAAGVDVTAFTSHVDNKTTFLTPIAAHAPEVTKAMSTAIEAVLLGKAEPASLVAANKAVNDIMAAK
jgi:multiple sugar transport system substrate-binding protein